MPSTGPRFNNQAQWMAAKPVKTMDERLLEEQRFSQRLLQEAEGHRRMVAQRDSDIFELLAHIMTKERELETQSGHLELQNRNITFQSIEIAVLNDLLSAKEKCMEHQKAVTARKDAQITEKDAEILSKTHEISKILESFKASYEDEMKKHLQLQSTLESSQAKLLVSSADIEILVKAYLAQKARASALQAALGDETLISERTLKLKNSLEALKERNKEQKGRYTQEISELETLVARKSVELKQKDDKIEWLSKQVQWKDAEVAQKDSQMEEKLRDAVSSKCADLQTEVSKLQHKVGLLLPFKTAALELMEDRNDMSVLMGNLKALTENLEKQFVAREELRTFYSSLAGMNEQEQGLKRAFPEEGEYVMDSKRART